MKHLLRCGSAAFMLAAVAWFVVPGGASADEAPRYYGALKLIGSVAKMDDITATGFTNNLDELNTSDLVGGFGAAIGYRWKNIPVHSEIEVSHRTRFDFDVRDDDTSIQNSDIGYKANVATTSVLFSAAFDWRNDSEFTPYLGALAGWSRHDAETNRNAGASNRDQSTDNFTWGIITGVIWDWNESWGVDIGYRYIDLGEVETGRFPTGESVQAESYTSHDITLSLLYRF